jgi:hypothetical protein
MFWLEKNGMASACEINTIAVELKAKKLYDCFMTIAFLANKKNVSTKN